MVALLTNVICAEDVAPMTVGVNVTMSLQVLPGLTARAQVLRLTVNGADTLTEVIISGVAPLFVTKTVLVPMMLIRLIPKATLAAVAVVAMPVPLTLTTEGEPTALWTMLIVAACAPAEVGLKVTLMVQEPKGATGARQLLTALNCVLLEAALLTKRLALPVLVIVMI